jgi:DNA-binding GntR family transcriptional regulator
MATMYTSKTDLVAAMLRELIMTGEFPPGAPLRQRDLAARLGVSPTPVREALRRLESEGLVKCDVHRGSTVAESEAGPIEENYRIRAALESLGAQMAADRITAGELTTLEEMNARMSGMADGDPAYGDLNRRFHFAIYEAAKSPMLLSLMRLLWQSLPEGPKVLRTRAESARQHADLLGALRRGDGQAAGDITRAHIEGSVHLDEERKPPAAALGARS